MSSTSNEYSYLNARVFAIDHLGNEMYKKDDTPIIENIASEQVAPIIPARKGNIARTYTYIMGQEALKNIEKIHNSITTDRKVMVNTISDILQDIKDNLQNHECISRLLIISHGYIEHIMGVDAKPVFTDLEHVKKSGTQLSNAMCKNGKIVIFACDAANSQEMLIEFSKSVGVRVLGNQGIIRIENRRVLQNRITDNYSLAKGTYFSWFYKEYNAILYSSTKPWKIFSPNGTISTFNPIGTDNDPVLKENDKIYISKDKLFTF